MGHEWVVVSFLSLELDISEEAETGIRLWGELSLTVKSVGGHGRSNINIINHKKKKTVPRTDELRLVNSLCGRDAVLVLVTAADLS